MAGDTPRVLFHFTSADSGKDWQTVNDGVMGGVSEGKAHRTAHKTLEFSGTLSLENNGGFASVRSKPRELSLEQGDVLIARVRGDGRQYSMNLYVPSPLIAFSYRARVETIKDEWIEVRLPLDRFVATHFGRPVQGTGQVDPRAINSLGFLLADKKAGPFRLEVDWIQVERETW